MIKCIYFAFLDIIFSTVSNIYKRFDFRIWTGVASSVVNNTCKTGSVEPEDCFICINNCLLTFLVSF